MLASLGVLVVSPAAPAAERLDPGSRERLLVVAPHPDDETLAAGGLLQRVLARGGSARVVLMTAGDGYVEAVVHATGLPQPRPAAYIAYGERRLGETRAALRTLGANRIRLQLLGFPDGGLGQLLHGYWQRSHPERSPTTGAREPPYPEAIARDVPYDGADLLRELVQLLRDTQPTIVAFPEPADRHPDHRASGLFTLLALERWLRNGAPPPRLLAYLVHWPGWPPGWNDDHPAPDAEREALELPPALPGDRTVLTLTDDETRGKRAALARYESQLEEMRPFLTAFVRKTEPFVRLSPDQVKHVDRMVDLTPTRVAP